MLRAIQTHLGSRQVSRVIYGAIVGLALIVALEAHPPSSAVVVATLLGSALAVALAELYSELLGVETRSRRHVRGAEVRHMASDAVAVAAGISYARNVVDNTVSAGIVDTTITDSSSLTVTAAETADITATAVGIAATGTILAALVPGSLGATPWTPDRTAAFDGAVAIAGVVVTIVAAVLVVRVRRLATEDRPQRDGQPHEGPRARVLQLDHDGGARLPAQLLTGADAHLRARTPDPHAAGLVHGRGLRAQRRALVLGRRAPAGGDHGPGERQGPRDADRGAVAHPKVPAT